MTDNPFNTPVSGQADWDSGLGLDFQVIERGYHITERAGTAISTGQVLWMNSGGFFFPFDPNSKSISPSAFSYMAAASGDSMPALAWGIVRSLGVGAPGELLFTSATTPGLAVRSYAGAFRPIGMGLSGGGILFAPARVTVNLRNVGDLNLSSLGNGQVVMWSDATSTFVMGTVAAGSGGGATTFGALTDVNTTGLVDGAVMKWSNAASQWIVSSDAMTAAWPQMVTTSLAIACVVGVTQPFTLTVGSWGWNRETVMIGSSADLVTLKMFAKADLTNRLYETKSGGVSVVGSYQDRAAFPFENADTSIGQLIYGQVTINSGAAVTSDTISIQCKWDKHP